jgi:hypothetical protein
VRVCRWRWPGPPINPSSCRPPPARQPRTHLLRRSPPHGTLTRRAHLHAPATAAEHGASTAHALAWRAHLHACSTYPPRVGERLPAKCASRIPLPTRASPQMWLRRCAASPPTLWAPPPVLGLGTLALSCDGPRDTALGTPAFLHFRRLPARADSAQTGHDTEPALPNAGETCRRSGCDGHFAGSAVRCCDAETQSARRHRSSSGPRRADPSNALGDGPRGHPRAARAGSAEPWTQSPVAGESPAIASCSACRRARERLPVFVHSVERIVHAKE